MTHVLGIRNNHAVYLIADCASSSHTPSNNHRTFSQIGQNLKQNSISYIADDVCKILNFDRFAAAFAGNIDNANIAIASIQRLIDHGYDVTDALKITIQSIQPLPDDPNRKFALLIAQHDANHGPLLASFNLNNNKTILNHSPGSLVIIGSGKQQTNLYTETIHNIFDRLGTSDKSTHKTLVSILGCMNLLAVQHNLVDDRIAGIFFGILVDRSGCYWQPDITYVLINGQPPLSTEFITALVRNNILCSYSTITLIYRYLANSLTAPLIFNNNDPKINPLLQEMETITRSYLRDYYIFLNTDRYHVLCVPMYKKLTSKSFAINIVSESPSETNVVLYFAKEFQEHWTMRLRDIAVDELAIGFSWLGTN